MQLFHGVILKHFKLTYVWIPEYAKSVKLTLERKFVLFEFKSLAMNVWLDDLLVHFNELYRNFSFVLLAIAEAQLFRHNAALSNTETRFFVVSKSFKKIFLF